MAVEREEIDKPFAMGKAEVRALRRHAAGNWTAEFDVNFLILLSDGREIIVNRRVNVRANEQRGRKRACR